LYNHKYVEIGYYFIKNNALSNTADMIIKCTNENCAIENTASVANCNSNDNIGKFNTNKKLCVANRKETAVMGNEGVYLMSFGVENPFGSVIKSGKPGVIKMDATSVKIDTTQTNVCVNDTTYAVSSRSGSTCTAGSTVYTCNNTGSCVAGSSAPTSSGKLLNISLLIICFFIIFFFFFFFFFFHSLYFILFFGIKLFYVNNIK